MASSAPTSTRSRSRELPETHRRLRGVPEDRRPLGAPAHVRDLREDRLLRLVAEPARVPARARGRAPDRPLRRARRGLELVLRRRGRVRGRRDGAAAAASATPSGSRRRTTLHLWAQIVGKVKLASCPPKNHWWHVPLYVDVRGLTTRLPALGGRHRLRDPLRLRRPPAGRRDGDGASGVVRARRRAVGRRRSTGGCTDAARRARRGDPREAVRRADDDAVPGRPRARVLRRRRGRALLARARLERRTCSRSSPAGSAASRAPCTSSGTRFDLAVTRFSGRPAPPMPDADPVTREAYTHEVVSFGFWAGDQNVREPTYYSYAAPEPDGLREQPLAPPAGALGRAGRGLARACCRTRPCATAADPQRDAARLPRERVRGGRRRGRLGPRGRSMSELVPDSRRHEPAPAADARRRDPRLRRGDDRRDDRQRRAAGDRARPRRRAARAAVGVERLPARARAR